MPNPQVCPQFAEGPPAAEYHGQRASLKFIEEPQSFSLLAYYSLQAQKSPLQVQLITMSALNRGVRTATRNLRLPALQPRALRAPLTIASRAKSGAPTRSATFKKFSTMSPLQSGAPPPPQAREYDPEIKDIASYVHHTPIESDLAVSFPEVSLNDPADTLPSSTQLDSFFLIP
jgi:2-methylcitrate dehydratase